MEPTSGGATEINLEINPECRLSKCCVCGLGLDEQTKKNACVLKLVHSTNKK